MRMRRRHRIGPLTRHWKTELMSSRSQEMMMWATQVRREKSKTGSPAIMVGDLCEQMSYRENLRLTQQKRRMCGYIRAILSCSSMYTPANHSCSGGGLLDLWRCWVRYAKCIRLGGSSSAENPSLAPVVSEQCGKLLQPPSIIMRKIRSLDGGVHDKAFCSETR